MKNNFLFFVGQLSLWMVNLCLKYYTFCPLFYPIFTCMDPDPYWEYGSTKLLNMDPIQIRIHNTACRLKYSIPVVPYFPSWFLFPQNCCRRLLVTDRMIIFMYSITQRDKVFKNSQTIHFVSISHNVVKKWCIKNKLCNYK